MLDATRVAACRGIPEIDQQPRGNLNREAFQGISRHLETFEEEGIQEIEQTGRENPELSATILCCVIFHKTAGEIFF